MYRIGFNDRASYILVGLLFCSAGAKALDIEPGIGAGLEYTNNATFSADNEENDLIAITYVGLNLDAGSGPFNFNANTSLTHQTYTQDTFGDENNFNLSATAGWEMIKNRLDWTMQDFFTQRSINTLDPATPDNTQDTNVFTFGPNIRFHISARQSVSLSPTYRKFTYETQNIDNQSNALDANWRYQLFRTMSIGLSGGVNKVDYDEALITDNTFRNIHLTLDGSRPRSEYSLSLGTTHVERESGASERGFTGSMSWELNLSGHSSVRALISSDLTDSNNGLLNSSTNPEGGDFSNEQTSSEVFRNSIVRLAYQRDDATLKSKVWTEFREEDYEDVLSLSDREVQSVGFGFSYPVTATVSTGMDASYNRTELIDQDREDDRYSLSGNINYRISRQLRSVARLKYQDRDSSLDAEDYSEASVFVGIVYGYGQAPHATRSGGGI